MRANCSYTAQPNTPEADRMRTVPHVVQVRTENGEEKVLVQATDPGAAIEMVNGMTEARYAGLPRV